MTDSVLSLISDARRAYRGGATAVAERQRKRLAEMVRHARSQSPYYRNLYRDLPERIEDPALLPVTDKKALMAAFDDWVTDREVTLAAAQAFADDPDLAGCKFAGQYTLETTSGTTGRRGVFLLDDRTMAVTGAILFRCLASWLNFGDFVRIIVRGGRLSMVMATGGHFASAVAAARLQRSPRGKATQVLSVHTPLPEIVAELNRFQPALVTPYASMAALLASEAEAGRLRIKPVLMVLSAEGLPDSEYGRIARAFDCKVGNSYAASECTFLSYSCAHGWLHVNSDWVAFEPVDADHRPVPPGEPAHTILISNLANRIQPILRYDLGDSVVQRPDPCPCGNPLPAIRVQGRSADVLTFQTEREGKVVVPPLAFRLVLDSLAGVEIAQLVQTAPNRLRLRVRLASGTDAETAWRTAREGLTHALAERGLQHVEIERAEEPPEQAPGGKFREIIPLANASHHAASAT